MSRDRPVDRGATELELTGVHGTLVVRRWDAPSPRYLAVIAHGYGEHSARGDEKVVLPRATDEVTDRRG